MNRFFAILYTLLVTTTCTAQKLPVRYATPGGGTSTISIDTISESVKVENYRSKGDSDIRVWEKARDTAQARSLRNGITCRITAGRNPTRADGRYIFTRTLIFPYLYNVNIYAPEAVINVQIEGFGFIDNGHGGIPSIDTSYPTETYLGPLRGAAIYIVRSGNEQINIGRIEGARFGIAWFTDSNSPVITFSIDNCNVGCICYQGSQNYTLRDCSGGASGAWFIGTATCFSANSPYKNSDNCYLDGFTWTTTAHPKAATAYLNPKFDTWFRGSIQRNTVPSYSATSNGTTYYANDTLNDFCNPSGWLVYGPFINGRNCFSPTIDGVDSRGGLDRGIALFNTTVQGLVWTGELALEQIGNQAAGIGKGYVVVGTVGSARVDIQFDFFDAAVYGNNRNKMNYTGRGYLTDVADVGGKGVNFTGKDWSMKTGITWLDRVIYQTQYYTVGVLQSGTGGSISFRSLDKNLVIYPAAYKGAKLYVEGFINQQYDCSNTSFSNVDLRDRSFVISRTTQPGGTITDNYAVSGRLAVFCWDYGAGDPKVLEGLYKKGLIQ